MAVLLSPLVVVKERDIADGGVFSLPLRRLFLVVISPDLAHDFVVQ
jgi:hypothetical protein